MQAFFKKKQGAKQIYIARASIAFPQMMDALQFFKCFSRVGHNKIRSLVIFRIFSDKKTSAFYVGKNKPPKKHSNILTNNLLESFRFRSKYGVSGTQIKILNNLLKGSLFILPRFFDNPQCVHNCINLFITRKLSGAVLFFNFSKVKIVILPLLKEF
jgi:hypothetical protein